MCTWGLGPDLWIRMSLTHFADLTDVTLADVDINSILLREAPLQFMSPL